MSPIAGTVTESMSPIAGTVTECAFARWRILIPSCPDNLMLSRLFDLARGVWRCVFSTWSVRTCFLQLLSCGEIWKYFANDQQVLTLHQVKAHDVKAFAASKVFQLGIPLEQILSTCHWKSHNTFTQFCLKDVLIPSFFPFGTELCPLFPYLRRGL